MVKTCISPAGILIMAILGFFPVARAQSGETEVGEVAGLGGVSLAAGAMPALAGSSGIALSRYLIGVFDTSFIPLGQRTIQPWPERSTIDHSYLFDFGVDLHVRIPVKRRWAPYGIVGAGLLWNSLRQHTVDEEGIHRNIHYNQFNGALHTGGGMRFYVGEGWGLRSEIKVIASKQVYTQVLMGVFYVTPANWP